MPDAKYKWLFSSSAMKSSMSLLLILLGPSISAQMLEVKLVDGRNGRPIVGSTSYVNAWIGTERKEAIAIPTDEEGVARLRLTFNASEVNTPHASINSGSVVVQHPIVTYNESFRVNAPYAMCRSTGTENSWLRSDEFLTKEILQHGYVSPNTCGKATASSRPGEIILFVRSLTWREKLKQ